MKTGRKPTHGYSYTRIYGIWANMRQRCENTNNGNWNDYGGRGIGYDPRWKDFLCFLEDMGERPAGMTLDRIDTNGSYTKENCRWATMKEQENNRRNNRRIRGKTLVEWSVILEIPISTLANRLYILKWPDDKIVSTPLLTKGGKVASRENAERVKAALV